MDPHAPASVPAMPARRRVDISSDGVRVSAVSRLDPTVSEPWSTRAVPLPEGSESSFRVHAAFAHEWSVDLVVGYRSGEVEDRVELWRVGPAGLAAPPVLLTDDTGRPVLPITGVIRQRPWDGEVLDGRRECLLEFEHVGPRQVTKYLMRSDALRFDRPEVRRVTTERRRYQVFISYKAQDTEAFSRKLNEHLLRLGVTTWFAPQQEYVDYERAILDGIEDSAHFLIVLSPNSLVPSARAPSTDLSWDGQADPGRHLDQKSEIARIVEHTRQPEHDAKGRILCALDWEGQLPHDLENQRWHLHTLTNTAARLGLSGIDPDRLASELALLVSRMVHERASASASTRR